MADHLSVAAPKGGLLELSCPYCGRKEIFPMESIIRGVEYPCDGCDAIVKIARNSPRTRAARLKCTLDGETTEFDFDVRHDGVWMYLNDDERNLIEIVEHDSDRAIAIIAGSMIENRIKTAILVRSFRDEKIEERLFQPSGALGSFSAKIDLARLLGIISKEAHADLVVMKDIRNLFAHYLDIENFQSQRIKDKTKNLKLVDTHVADFKPSNPTKKGEAIKLAHGSVPKIFVRNASRKKKLPRERYLMTAQLFAAHLAPLNLTTWPLPFV